VDVVQAIGADHVVDYKKGDYTLDDRRYDLMLDVAGSEYSRVLTPAATVVQAGGPRRNRFVGLSVRHFLGMRIGALFGSRKAHMFLAKLTRDDLEVLGELLESGKMTPVLDRQYPLQEAAEALRYLDEGHARGKIVITM
jgi:NADPH:quinone reductase-like Zn-dependent oxidoreductase